MQARTISHRSSCPAGVVSTALLGAVLLCAVAAGCGGDAGQAGRGESAGVGPDTLVGTVTGGEDVASTPTAESTALPLDSASLAAIRRFRALVPADQLVRRGACPFECCTYREWTAEGEIPVLAEERGAGRPLFTLSPGQRFHADSGNVWITSLLLVAVHDPVGDPPYWSFERGDTLVVLDHIGEGHFNVWHDGRVLDVEGFWAPWRQGGARTIGEHGSEWWVHVALPDGRTGWFEASPSVQFAGADACG
jgi:hypothetical protein